jgi:dTDP-4-amino-4,6-dideoxygalactose transaminase
MGNREEQEEMPPSATKALKKFVKTNPFLAKMARQQMQRVARVTNPWSLFPRDLPPTSLDYLQEVVASGFTADCVPQFEKKFAKMIGARYAVTVSNCTAAIHTVLACSGLEPGDEVIVSPIADYGDIQGLLTECLVPVFPDVDVVTGNVTAEHIERVLTPRSRAVLLVHFYGLAAEIRPIVELCERHGLLFIEDCCQSILACEGNAKTGTFGIAGCFSLDREKHLSTDGGGVIVTNDAELAQKYHRFAVDRGCEHKEGYGRIHSWLGYNYRYSMLQAAIGLAQLDTFEERMAQRMALAQRLAKQLEDVEGIMLPHVRQANGHAYWLFHFMVDPACFAVSVEELGMALAARRIPCRIAPYYLVPESHTLLHRPITPVSKDIMRGWELAAARYDYSAAMCPNAKTHLAHTLRWLWPERLSEVEVDKMGQIIKETLDKYRR